MVEEKNVFNTTSLICTLDNQSQTDEAFKVDGRKHTHTGIDAVKTASKRVVQKTAEATEDLIGNKIANRITSIGKPKEKPEEIYIPPEKRQ